MTTPDDASEVLREYFDKAADGEFRADMDRASSGLPDADPVDESQLTLLHPQRSALPLRAYLASALTGLTEEQRQLVFQLSDAIKLVCDEYGIDLYEPRKQTDPVHHADVPAGEVFRIDRERVLASDLVIHLCHFPSTGAGEELDFAHSALLPIFLVSHGATRVSRMVTGIPGLKAIITYSEPDELRQALRDALIQIRPVLEQRKLAFSSYDRNVVGEKVRLLREAQGLTRDDVAKAAGEWLDVEILRQLEESSDRLANPNLITLRQIAAVLKTTVAELVEPDLSEQLVSVLQDLMAEPAAARFSGVSGRDRRRLLRAMMQRITEALGDEDEDLPSERPSLT
jgi:transcriptional regulator with XRE-family HTH domain